jgi:hypothetical protein
MSALKARLKTTWQVGEILKLSRAGGTPCVRVLDLARRHLAAIDERIQQLARFRDTLAAEVGKWDGVREPTCGGLCQIIAVRRSGFQRGFASIFRRARAAEIVVAWARFDTRQRRAHPKTVPRVLTRIASVVCTLALAQSALAACAGWQATPEARRQCCQDGACPLHHHSDKAPRTRITQSEADDCCAQSQRHESSPSGTVFASTMTLAVVSLVPDAVPAALPRLPLNAPWETSSPPPHVAKHLLFSILLV